MENMTYIDYLQSSVKQEEGVFIAPNATLLGDITLQQGSSVWYGAVLRADMDSIVVGPHTNIQDLCILHTDPNFPIRIGRENVIGHGAVVHGCTIGDYNLIGIRCTILNGAKIGNGCVIGAGALVTEDMVVPDFSMVVGVPGKVVKQMPEHITEKIRWGAYKYSQEVKKYLAGTAWKDII